MSDRQDDGPMEVNPDWWKSLFDETYLITDARSVRDGDLTGREVDMLETALGLEKAWPILDMCGGQGRHSLELCARGFEDVTVVDYSQYLVERGIRASQGMTNRPTFRRADARNTDLPSGRFRAAIVMANSFGYFADPDDDRRVLAELYRLLTPGGVLLLDLTSKEFIYRNFSPVAWHEADNDVVVCRERCLDDDCLSCREIVLSKKDGLIRDATYRVRLYTPEAISALLDEVGFVSIKADGNYTAHMEKGDFGFLNNRMIVLATKP